VITSHLFPCIVQLMETCTNAGCVHKAMEKCAGVCTGFRDVIGQSSGSCPGALISEDIHQNHTTQGSSGDSKIARRARVTSGNGVEASLDSGLQGKCAEQ